MEAERGGGGLSLGTPTPRSEKSEYPVTVFVDHAKEVGVEHAMNVIPRGWKCMVPDYVVSVGRRLTDSAE